MLRAKHKNNFLVWNLSEREYEYDLLDNQIVCVPFKDHHAPPLHIIFQIIQHIDWWLRANSQHVAIVHCMGGKGRTGLIIVCYLFFSGLFTDIHKCLTYFALRRSATGKGVTQPSQLPGNTTCKATIYRSIDVVLVHILKCRRRCLVEASIPHKNSIVKRDARLTVSRISTKV